MEIDEKMLGLLANHSPLPNNHIQGIFKDTDQQKTTMVNLEIDTYIYSSGSVFCKRLNETR
jgi:methionine salvage enolase-phosphatase E1